VKKAIIAIAHRLITAIYHILVHRMQRRIEQLGFEFIIQPLAAPAA
jgi:hypothetical protein